MAKPYAFLSVAGLTFRLAVLVLPLPALATTSSPIASCTPPEVQTLIGKLASAGNEQERAIATLSQCRDAADPLIWQLENSPNVQARSAVVAVLEQMGAPAVEGLVRLVGDRSRPEEARSLAIDVLSQIAQGENTSSAEQLKIVELLTQRSIDSQESASIQIEATRALRQIRSGAGRSATGQPVVEQIRGWVEQNPAIATGIGLTGTGAGLYLLTLWLKPPWLLTLIPTNLTIPKLDWKVPDGALRWLKYQPRVLDRWVKERLDQSKKDFLAWESRLELNSNQPQSIYIPIPFSVDGEKKDESFSLSRYLQSGFSSQTCLLIVGEGGTGKSSFACQIARWGAGWETAFSQSQQPLCRYPMLPIPVSWDLDKVEPGSEEQEPLLAAILKQLPKHPAPAANKELVKALLEKQRILVIVDRFSELSKETQAQIKKEVGKIPINALVMTSRREYEDLGRRNTLSPRRLIGSNIVYFIEMYLQRKGILDRIEDESTFVEEVWQGLRGILNQENEDATVLLVRLYLDRVVEEYDHQRSQPGLTQNLSNQLVKNIPELMDAYLIRLNKTVEQDHQSDEEVKEAVQTIASTCLERNSYQPKSAPRQSIIDELVKLDRDASVDLKTKVANARKRLDYLGEKLKLLEISSSNEVKIALDPLAEYFAALYWVSACQAAETSQEKEQRWSEFIATIDRSVPDSRASVEHFAEIKGFLRAVRKCCEVLRDVPTSALNALDERIEPDPEKREESQQRKRLQRAIADLQDNDQKYRQRAIEDLKEMGGAAKPAVRHLINVLENQNEELKLRRSALEILREIKLDTAHLAPPLMIIFENRDEALELRRLAFNFLITLDKAKQIIEPALIRIAKDRSEVGMRLHSVWYLKQLGKTIPELTANIEDSEIQIKPLKPLPKIRVEEGVQGLKLEMVQIPAGSFWMGSPEGDEEGSDDERPRHEVTIEKSFWMGKYPVTQTQWKTVAELPKVNIDLDPDPSEFKGTNRPVEWVSWLDAVEFCDRLSRKTNQNYRLPSEAEWEYACRAKTETLYSFGDKITPILANYNDSRMNETTPVGYFGVANAFGLYDMHGNVWEWCADHWHENYQDAPSDGGAWLTDDNEARRLMRGGSWRYNPGCRSAFRRYDNPDDRRNNVGFRIVCVFA